MKTRCPCCGAENSLDALVNHDAARAALWELTKLGDEMTQLAVTYVGMFRPEKSVLTFSRMAKLLEELRIQIDDGWIERNGQRHETTRAAWIHAFRTLIERRATGALSLPLKSHGYLYEVILSCQHQQAQAAQIEAKGSQSMNGLLSLESMKVADDGSIHQ